MTTRESFGFALTVAVGTDVGKVRSNNEDASGVSWLEDGSLLVTVADGMGGHEAGEVASGLAVRVLESVVARDLEADPRERLYNGLLEANQSIIEEGRASGTRGMGTTAIVGLCKGPEVHVGLVGDSRLYHFRRGQLLWRTMDHTRVQMLLDQGELSQEESRAHPESGMLTRALGHSRMADGRPLVPDVLLEPVFLEPGDAMVLCSDGVHDLMDDWEIGQMVSGVDPQSACDKLVAESLERGGHDNITVAVIVAGETSEDYDADYAPETRYRISDAPPDVEVTYDVFPAPDGPSTQPDLAEAQGGRRGAMMMGAVALAVAGLVAAPLLLALIAVLVWLVAG